MNFIDGLSRNCKKLFTKNLNTTSTDHGLKIIFFIAAIYDMNYSDGIYVYAFDSLKVLDGSKASFEFAWTDG